MSRQIQKTSNPQGKGIAGIADDLRASAPIQVHAKSSLQWLADYFTSTLVLGAKYGFKPIVGKQYYLYFKEHDWKLSLIEPHAWCAHDPGVYFAECVLSKDMSWGLVLAPDWQNHSTLVKTVKKLEKAFFESINDSTPLVEKLPFFMRQLSYYQRLGANALSRSLKQSLEMKLGKEKSLSFTGGSILAELEQPNTMLLETIS